MKSKFNLSFIDEVEKRFKSDKYLRNELSRFTDDFEPSLAEKHLIFEGLKLGVADCSQLNNTHKSGHDGHSIHQEVRISTLRRVIGIAHRNPKPSIEKIKLVNVILIKEEDEDSSLDYLSYEFSLQFSNCIFYCEVDFDSSRFRDIEFENCHFESSIDFDSVISHSIKFNSCSVSGSISAGGVESKIFSVKRCTLVGQMALFKSSIFHFEALQSIFYEHTDKQKYPGMETLSLTANSIDSSCVIEGSLIEGGLNLTRNTITDLIICQTIIIGKEIIKPQFNNGTVIDKLAPDKNKVRKSYSSINAKSLTISRCVRFHRSYASEHVISLILNDKAKGGETNSGLENCGDRNPLRRSAIFDQTQAKLEKMLGNLQSRLRWNPALEKGREGNKPHWYDDFSENIFLGKASFDGADFTGNIDLTNTIYCATIMPSQDNIEHGIALDLQTTRLSTGALYLNKGEECNLNLEFYGTCNLQNAHFHRLELSLEIFLSEITGKQKGHCRLNVSGLTYSFIRQYPTHPKGTKIGAKIQLEFCNWISVNPEDGDFTDQPFEELAKFYNRIGEHDTARKVRVNKNRFRQREDYERKLIRRFTDKLGLGPEQVIRYFIHLILVPIYGTFLKALVFLTFPAYKSFYCLLTIIGANILLFKMKINNEPSIVENIYNPEILVAPRFSSVKYAMERLIPFIDFDLTNYYWINNNLVNTYFDVSAILVIICIFMLLIGISSVTRKAH